MEKRGTVVPLWNFQTKTMKTPINKGTRGTFSGCLTRGTFASGFCGLLLRVRGLAPGGRGVFPPSPSPGPRAPLPHCAVAPALRSALLVVGVPPPPSRVVASLSPLPPAGAASPAPPWRGTPRDKNGRAFHPFLFVSHVFASRSRENK